MSFKIILEIRFLDGAIVTWKKRIEKYIKTWAVHSLKLWCRHKNFWQLWKNSYLSDLCQMFFQRFKIKLCIRTFDPVFFSDNADPQIAIHGKYNGIVLCKRNEYWCTRISICIWKFSDWECLKNATVEDTASLTRKNVICKEICISNIKMQVKSCVFSIDQKLFCVTRIQIFKQPVHQKT